MTKRTLSIGFSGALAALTVSALTGCNQHAETAPAAQPAPPTVTVAPVTEKHVTEWREFTGRTEAVETVEVRPRVSGHIQEVHFQSGQLVKKGDILFTIDPRWHEAEFDQKEAEYQQAKSSARDGGTRSQSHGTTAREQSHLHRGGRKLARRGFARQKPRCWALKPLAISRNSTWILPDQIPH